VVNADKLTGRSAARAKPTPSKMVEGVNSICIGFIEIASLGKERHRLLKKESQVQKGENERHQKSVGVKSPI
jgi:hypothetical protein